MKKSIITLFFLGCFFGNAQKSVAIYWDASYSMKDRDLALEFEFIDNYFKENTEVKVSLVMFSNEVIFNQEFTIIESNWDQLKAELSNTVYDGATSYANLFVDSFDELLLFTDGNENLDKLNPPKNKPLYIITSIENSNHIDLKLYADLSSGKYVYLKPSKSITKKKTKKEETKIPTRNVGIIKGTISSVEGYLFGANVLNLTTKSGVVSSKDGRYKIEGKIGDTLQFSYLGKKTVNVRLKDNNTVNISLPENHENLDEIVVTVEAEVLELMNTGNNRVDKKRIGYAIESIDSKAISDQDVDLKNAVKGQFSGLNIANDAGYTKVDISQFLGRGKNMSILGNQYGLVVVDGVPLSQSDSSNGQVFSHNNIINPELIVDITYLKGLAATNKYGTIGRNGVLVITTKNAVGDKATVKNTKPLGTTATYSGNAEQLAELPEVDYINRLKKANDVNRAFQIYLDEREKFGELPEFYIDCHDYFKGWNNKLISNRILSNVYELAYDDAVTLRALAYKQQENGYYKLAVTTLARVLKLKPKEAQSYKDLAQAYHFAGEPKKALKIYNDIDKGVRVANANFTGIKKTIINDTKNLIFKHESQLNTSGINPIYHRNIKYKSRIIFEWNDFDAEFDLNIINPQKRFFTWSHTNAKNRARINQEKSQGYGLEEFYLTSADVGEWMFNAKYYGKTSGNESPTFIKITIFKNFGQPNQSKEIKVIRLEKRDIEQTIAKVKVS